MLLKKEANVVVINKKKQRDFSYRKVVVLVQSRPVFFRM